ncbi:unnamed protein product [Arabidopsis halleri]
MTRFSLLLLFVLLFTVVFASRIHVVERRSFSSGPSRRDRGFLPFHATRVIGAGEVKPEKRKIPTGSNPLHNKR